MTRGVITQPMYESTFAFAYRGVGEAAEGALHLGQVRAGDGGWRLVVYAHLEPRRTPIIDQLSLVH